MGIGFLRLSLPQQGPTHRGPVRFLAISMSAFLGQPAPSQSHLSPRRVATLVLPPAACAGRPPCMRRHSRCVSEAVPPPHRWLFSLERGRRSCSEPLRCAPAEPLSERSKPIRAASSNSLSQGMSSSDELFTAGPAPAIATCCALHKRLPRPTLEPGVGRRAPPLSVYGPLSFLAHAAQIAPARITVIDSAMLASRVSSVRFQAKSPHPDYSKLLSGETFLCSYVLGRLNSAPVGKRVLGRMEQKTR